MKHDNSVLNVIYLNTAEKGPSGGGKTIYNHSHLINKLNIKNLTSEILHVKKKKISKWNTSLKKILKIDNSNYFGWTVNDITVSKNFKSRWFNKKIKIKNNFTFENKKDFVIFPEIFAHFAKKLCIEKKVPYAIFVQNGYCLNTTSDKKTLEDVYKSAKFILSYSKDIDKCVKLSFPNCRNKLFHTYLEGNFDENIC